MNWWTAFGKGWVAFWHDPSNISGVALPVAAILVSTIVAVWIASSERRAGRRDREREAVAQLGAAISAVGGTAIAAQNPAYMVDFNTALFDFNAASVHMFLSLRKRHRDVSRYFEFVMFTVTQTHNLLTIAAASGWLEGVLQDWTTGNISSKSLVAIANANGFVMTKKDPGDWKNYAKPLPGPLIPRRLRERRDAKVNQTG